MVIATCRNMIEVVALQTFRKLESHYILYSNSIYILACLPMSEKQFISTEFILLEEMIYSISE